MINRLSIKQRIFVLIGMVIIILGIGGVATYTTVLPLDKNFERYMAQIAKRNSLLMEIKSSFGYGGAIHNFKNYVLRGDKKYGDRFQNNIKSLKTTIEAYRQHAKDSEIELESLRKIEQVVLEYESMLPKVTEMTAKLHLPIRIDKVVKVDDTPAFEAFAQLEQEYQRVADLKSKLRHECQKAEEVKSKLKIEIKNFEAECQQTADLRSQLNEKIQECDSLRSQLE